MPASTMTERLCDAPANPMMSDVFVSNPSFTPKIAALSAPLLPADPVGSAPPTAAAIHAAAVRQQVVPLLETPLRVQDARQLSFRSDVFGRQLDVGHGHPSSGPASSLSAFSEGAK